jgi:methyl coenzyme M reductase alpha subunit
MFHHAAGGYAQQGTLCGSIGSCAAIINLVAMDKNNTHMKLLGDLISWYSQCSFPSQRFDSIATYKNQIQTAAVSSLCHTSVSGWMMAAKLSKETENCLSCHGTKATDNQKGQMNCVSCHDDHTK